MNDKVKELVEWVAERICTLSLNVRSWSDLDDSQKESWRVEAKKILNHPDLALMIGKSINLPGEGMTWETYYHAIPLAEALEEEK